jgi:hypothetical protein
VGSASGDGKEKRRSTRGQDQRSEIVDHEVERLKRVYRRSNPPPSASEISRRAQSLLREIS